MVYFSLQRLLNDPLEVIMRREKIEGKNEIEDIIHQLLLPDCYFLNLTSQEKPEEPYKQLLIWAALSKK